MKTYFIQRFLNDKPLGPIHAIVASHRKIAFEKFGASESEARIVYEVDPDRTYNALTDYQKSKKGGELNAR